jgi:predicted Zn-dependent protease
VTVRLVVALACLTGVVVSVIARDSRIAGEEALLYLAETGDRPGTVERLIDARRLNPNSGIDVVRARLVPPGEAVALLRRSVRNEPESVELWVALAQAQIRAGDRAGGQRSYARARELAPRFLPPDGPPDR